MDQAPDAVVAAQHRELAQQPLPLVGKLLLPGGMKACSKPWRALVWPGWIVARKVAYSASILAKT